MHCIIKMIALGTHKNENVSDRNGNKTILICTLTAYSYLSGQTSEFVNFPFICRVLPIKFNSKTLLLIGRWRQVCSSFKYTAVRLRQTSVSFMNVDNNYKLKLKIML